MIQKLRGKWDVGACYAETGLGESGKDYRWTDTKHFDNSEDALSCFRSLLEEFNE